MSSGAHENPTVGADAVGRLITVSATYGAGGSVIAPALAHRLGVPCLQRLTTTAGGGLAEQPASAERLSAGEAKTTPVHRLLASLSHALPAGPTQSPPPPATHHRDLRREAEASIHRVAAAGEGVILGRAAAVVLGKGHGYHVRLDGPPARRIAQGALIEGIGLDEARVHMAAADRARTAYVRRLYGVDPADASLYHLVIDSTVMPIEAVVELILTAARETARAAAVTTPAHASARG
jgi:cytidylate kinase